MRKALELAWIILVSPLILLVLVCMYLVIVIQEWFE